VTREHDALRDLIAPVALGAASPAETTRVEAHAAECAVCADELRSLRASADVLAVAVPQHVPRPELKASVMATVRAEAAARRPAPEPPAARAPRAPSRMGWLRGGLRPAFAVLGAVVALVAGWGIASQLGDGGDDDVTTIAVAGTRDAPGIEGRVVYVPDEDTAVVQLENLPVIGADEAYQLWVLREGAPPRSAGLFSLTGPGQARTVASGLRGAQGLAVTAQPRSSRTAPEGPILVQAPLEA
jgi:anti-sigma-K factor RskA